MIFHEPTVAATEYFVAAIVEVTAAVVDDIAILTVSSTMKALTATAAFVVQDSDTRVDCRMSVH